MSGASTDWKTPVVLNSARPKLPRNRPPAAAAAGNRADGRRQVGREKLGRDSSRAASSVCSPVATTTHNQQRTLPTLALCLGGGGVGHFIIAPQQRVGVQRPRLLRPPALLELFQQGVNLLPLLRAHADAAICSATAPAGVSIVRHSHHLGACDVAAAPAHRCPARGQGPASPPLQLMPPALLLVVLHLWLLALRCGTACCCGA